MLKLLRQMVDRCVVTRYYYSKVVVVDVVLGDLGLENGTIICPSAGILGFPWV